MARTIIGKVGLTPRQTYNSTTEYKRLDIVTHEGSSYLCLKDCAGIDVSDTEYWQLLADRGAKGDTGEQGIQGERGLQGEKGDKGDKGDKPVVGVDYFTEEEKEEFKSYCDQQIGIIETLLQEV